MQSWCCFVLLSKRKHTVFQLILFGRKVPKPQISMKHKPSSLTGAAKHNLCVNAVGVDREIMKHAKPSLKI